MSLGLRRRITVAALAAALATAGFGFLVAEPAAASPTGFVLIANSRLTACALGSIDLGSGQITGLNATTCSLDLALRSDGTLFGVDDTAGDLITYNTSTGSTHTVGPLGIDTETTEGLSFDSSGTLWLIEENDQSPCGSISTPNTCLYKVDPTSGAANFVTAVSSGGANTTVTGLAAPCSGGLVTIHTTPPAVDSEPTAAATTTSSSATSTTTPTLRAQATPAALASLNTATGVVTDVGPTGALQLPVSLDFDGAQPQGLWGIGESGGAPTPSVFTFNQQTGAASPTAAATGITTGFFLTALAIPAACTTAAAPPVVAAPLFTG